MQPVSGYQFKRISGTVAGTTIISVESTNLHAILIGENKTGTVTFYNDGTTTTTAQYMFALQNTCGTVGQNFIIDAQCPKGLTVATGGTTDLFITYN